LRNFGWLDKHNASDFAQRTTAKQEKNELLIVQKAIPHLNFCVPTFIQCFNIAKLTLNNFADLSTIASFLNLPKIIVELDFMQ